MAIPIYLRWNCHRVSSNLVAVFSYEGVKGENASFFHEKMIYLSP